MLIKEEKKENQYQVYPCDLCAETEAVEIPRVREYTNGQVIHVCKNCGFIYVKRRRSFDVIAKVWSDEIFGNLYTARSPLMLARHTYIAEFIDQNVGLKGKIVTDIGAGEGQFLNIVQKNYGANGFGIEHSPRNGELLKRLNIRSFTGALEDYLKSEEKKEFSDIVTMMWTLENATNPRQILSGAYQILKKGGYVVVATGSRILVPFAKPLSLYLSTNPADTHPSRFSVNTLSSMLSVSGFKVRYINPYLNDGMMLCVIGEKSKIDPQAKIKGDDYREVIDFFERWHKEGCFGVEKFKDPFKTLVLC